MINKKLFCKDHFAARIYLVLFYSLVLALILYFPLIINKIGNPYHSREIYVSAFSDVVTEDLLRKFEAETGIKVNSKYCDQDPEMWTQLYMNSEHGYDLMTPTDYMIKIMIDDGLLQKIKIEELEDYQNIERQFMHLPCDPKNEFSVPFAWSVHGIGYRDSFFYSKKERYYPDSLAFIFTPEAVFGKKALKTGEFKNYRMCVVDEPMELTYLASIFLFGEVDNFTPERLELIKKTLIGQRRWTKAYTSSDVNYYLGHCAQVVLALGAHVKKAMDSSEKYLFQIPKEGSIMAIQHLCIPKDAKNPDLALKLINFLLKPENQASIFNQSGFAPVNNLAKPLIDVGYTKNENFFPKKEAFSKIFTLNSNLSVKQAEELVVTVKTN